MPAVLHGGMIQMQDNGFVGSLQSFSQGLKPLPAGYELVGPGFSKGLGAPSSLSGCSLSYAAQPHASPLPCLPESFENEPRVLGLELFRCGEHLWRRRSLPGDTCGRGAVYLVAPVEEEQSTWWHLWRRSS
ncbi:Hypothetical predicted protein [Marmota monax]|uniref:Uncharacterized protein n=1 Tax=Marmota monax TaxID=9995 RepID=A0A5E4B5D7_MARMO|nr:Hypothetical predicted protein [Marmota monax]